MSHPSPKNTKFVRRLPTKMVIVHQSHSLSPSAHAWLFLTRYLHAVPLSPSISPKNISRGQGQCHSAQGLGTPLNTRSWAKSIFVTCSSRVILNLLLTRVISVHHNFNLFGINVKTLWDQSFLFENLKISLDQTTDMVNGIDDRY